MKNNVTDDKDVKWDDFIESEILSISDIDKKEFQEIFDSAISKSKKARDWYWASIESKKFWSILIRCITFILVLTGAVLPILAGMNKDLEKSLQFTQSAVAILAAAGLFYNADKVFGWSSGWLRYISTVSEMEAITQKFRLDWAEYFITKSISTQDFKKSDLFEKAEKLQNDIKNLQNQETEKWVTEYNENSALLGELINTQRKTTERAEQAAKQVLKAKEEELERKKAEEERIKELGSKGDLQVKLNHTGSIIPVNISIDEGLVADGFVGNLFAKKDIDAGNYVIKINYGENNVTDEIVTKIEPSQVSDVEFEI
jgi:hypothetical protein